MAKCSRWTAALFLCATVAAVLALAGGRLTAHCDTLDGPVVAEARAALEKGQVAPVLKWVKADDEAEVRQTFQQALAVRKLSPEARELADRWFFETLVRVHRAGEGAPYTGLKAGPAEAIVVASDKAVESGSVDELAKTVSAAVSAGIRERFARVAEARKHKDASIEAGRRYVAAYVEFTHYVERLHQDAAGVAGEQGHGAEAAPAEHAHGPAPAHEAAPDGGHPSGHAPAPAQGETTPSPHGEHGH